MDYSQHSNCSGVEEAGRGEIHGTIFCKWEEKMYKRTSCRVLYCQDNKVEKSHVG